MATKKRRSKTNPPQFRLLIVRHAHRDKPRGSLFDNGLSGKGKKQAKQLVKFYGTVLRKKKNQVVFLSSPKKRAVETLMPLAKKLKKEIFPCEFINEGPKTFQDLEGIVSLINHYSSDKDMRLVLCSHGDTIPWLTKLLIGTTFKLEKGGCVELVENFEGQFTFQISQVFQDIAPKALPKS